MIITRQQVLDRMNGCGGWGSFLNKNILETIDHYEAQLAELRPKAKFGVGQIVVVDGTYLIIRIAKRGFGMSSRIWRYTTTEGAQYDEAQLREQTQEEKGPK